MTESITGGVEYSGFGEGAFGEVPFGGLVDQRNLETIREELDHPLVDPHRDTTLYTLLAAISEENFVVDRSIETVHDQAYVDEATDEQLELLGAVVGVDRQFGESDDRYRRRVKAGYLRANAAGLFNEIGEIAMVLLDTEPSEVSILRAKETSEPALASVAVRQQALDDAPFTQSEIEDILSDSVIGGHRVVITIKGSFEFADGTDDHGFDDGIWSEGA